MYRNFVSSIAVILVYVGFASAASAAEEPLDWKRVQGDYVSCMVSKADELDPSGSSPLEIAEVAEAFCVPIIDVFRTTFFNYLASKTTGADGGELARQGAEKSTNETLKRTKGMVAERLMKRRANSTETPPAQAFVPTDETCKREALTAVPDKEERERRAAACLRRGTFKASSGKTY